MPGPTHISEVRQPPLPVVSGFVCDRLVLRQKQNNSILFDRPDLGPVHRSCTDHVQSGLAIEAFSILYCIYDIEVLELSQGVDSPRIELSTKLKNT